MGDFSGRNFGLLIAYVIPGFLSLWGLSFGSGTVREWLRGAGAAGPSVGGAFFVLIACIACGMTANAVRWATVDQVHHLTGLPHPAWDDSRLQDNLEAFDYLVENHFRYYQFYAASIVSMLLAYGAWRLSGHKDPTGGAEFAVSVLAGVFLACSRDALRKYYAGTSLLVGTVDKEHDHDERTPSPDGIAKKYPVSQSLRESFEVSRGDSTGREHEERFDRTDEGPKN